jgi:hypothetical protein
VEIVVVIVEVIEEVIVVVTVVVTAVGIVGKEASVQVTPMRNEAICLQTVV